MSKICCVFHNCDLDGWMSAAIVKHWFIETNKPNNYIINGTETARGGNPYNPNSLNFIGYNYGQPIPDLSEYDKVIMCDISFPKEEMIKLRLGKDNIKGKNIIWLDHHISAINDLKEDIERGVYIEGIRDIKFAACELTWKYFFPNEPMPEIVRLLGRYDCFGHKGTDEEQKVLEFQYGARAYIKNYEDAYVYLIKTIGEDLNSKMTLEFIHTAGKSIYSYLCTDAQQSYKNGFEIVFQDNTKTDEHGYPVIDGIKFRKFICINKERFNPINFGIDYNKEGYDGCACFYLRSDGKWSFSLYNDNGLVDCSLIAKQYGGGGHAGASGFICDSETMLNILKSK